LPIFRKKGVIESSLSKVTALFFYAKTILNNKRFPSSLSHAK